MSGSRTSSGSGHCNSGFSLAQLPKGSIRRRRSPSRSNKARYRASITMIRLLKKEICHNQKPSDKSQRFRKTFGEIKAYADAVIATLIASMYLRYQCEVCRGKSRMASAAWREYSPHNIV
jgi:hypothetical protein